MNEASLRKCYAWACDVLYHDLAWSYDWVSWGVSAGAWDGWRQLALTEARAAGAAAPMLEIGFGTGELLVKAARSSEADAAPVIGLELSPQMHAVAAAKFAAHGVVVPRVQATACAMPFQAGAFSVVFATFPASYIVAPATLQECARVLQVGGRLIIVGLWVVPMVAGQELQLPLLYGAPSAAQIDRVVQCITRAGFVVEVHMRQSRGAAVAVVMGVKQPEVEYQEEKQ